MGASFRTALGKLFSSALVRSSGRGDCQRSMNSRPKVHVVSKNKACPANLLRHLRRSNRGWESFLLALSDRWSRTSSSFADHLKVTIDERLSE